MELVIDVGNSRIKYAVFEGRQIIHHQVLEGFDSNEITTLLENYPCQTGIVSASGNIPEGLPEILKGKSEILYFDTNISLPITIHYETPETLGKDRIAGMVGAWTLFPEQSSLVIDMGTCITTNIINNKGQFLGGTISPGVAMRAKAMHDFTAALPLVSLDLPHEFIGRDTTTSLQNGVIRGTYYELQMFIDQITPVFGINNVILTGGDAKIFGNLLNFEIFALPNLVLSGLHEILQYNV